ncbi:MAG: endonuclease/exonuclease/phosphatase family protein [Candidatus Gastranaerophilales bacterium]|nr:endonuclease/exonuclease/phosphatase family protein [Candidatus Gastranaerophilales bacterium]
MNKKIFLALSILLVNMLILLTSEAFAQIVNLEADKKHEIVMVNDFSKLPKIKNKELFNVFYFDELTELSKTEISQDGLAQKLEYALTTPVIDNTIVPLADNYEFKTHEKIGKYIRVATWNIGRGMNIDKIKMIFETPELLLNQYKNVNEKELEEIKNQINILKNADIIILNEVDVGMPRTEYRNIVEELANAGGYNYTYGIEFLEVDPVHLGLEDYKWSEERFLKEEGRIKTLEIDKQKYKGLHGNAILSKFPLKNVRIIRLPAYYDWFNDERDRLSTIEHLRRNIAESVFQEGVIREIRRGSRMAIIADINIPEFNDKVTIVAVHLENRVLPKYRLKQLKILLNYLRHIKNPVILAGDFNTTMADGRPTTVEREFMKRIKDPHYVIRTAVTYLNPVSAGISFGTTGVDIIRKHLDPTVRSIPVIAPNKEKKFFNTLKKFDFKDNTKFDFRGQYDNSINGNFRKLANSNERTLKGFKPTYIFKRHFQFAKYKLDWIFVKAYAENYDSKGEPYKLAPHYGRTLYEMNYGLEYPISDHVPITTDLPIIDYTLKN